MSLCNYQTAVSGLCASLARKKTFCFLFKLFAEFPKFSALPFHSEEQEIISNEFFHIHASDFIYCEIIPLNVPL